MRNEEDVVRVLIAYGSRRGGTAGLAQMIADGFASAGVDAEVVPARTVRSLDRFDAVIVAGALYASRWHPGARRFVRRHADALRQRPVWLVASGPLDDSAVAGELPAVRHVASAMTRIGARGQVTFGGRLSPDARGFPARAMAKKRAGDWRDREQVHRWTASVVEQLERSIQPS